MNNIDKNNASVCLYWCCVWITQAYVWLVGNETMYFWETDREQRLVLGRAAHCSSQWAHAPRETGHAPMISIVLSKFSPWEYIVGYSTDRLCLWEQLSIKEHSSWQSAVTSPLDPWQLPSWDQAPPTQPPPTRGHSRRYWSPQFVLPAQCWALGWAIFGLERLARWALLRQICNALRGSPSKFCLFPLYLSQASAPSKPHAPQRFGLPIVLGAWRVACLFLSGACIPPHAKSQGPLPLFLPAQPQTDCTSHPTEDGLLWHKVT